MSCIWPKVSAKCSQVVDISSDAEEIADKINQTIDCLMFCREIQLISTNTDLIPIIEDYIQTTETLSYYLVKNTPIYVFIDKILINGFVKKGKLFCLSVNKEIDSEDCFALLPNGLLVLSVKESTYHGLGIVGKKSILYRNKNCVKKYLIEIDLKNENLIPGTKHFRRTLECLERSCLLFDVVIKWEVSEELKSQSISSMSIKNFFTEIKSKSIDCNSLSIQCFRCFPSLRKFVNNYVSVPLVSEEFLLSDIESLIEWFGAQVCQVDCEPTEDIDVSTFGEQFARNCDERHDISCVVLNGFFTSSDVKSLIDRLNEQIFRSGVNAIVVNGFEETPIGWKGSNNEHSKNLFGENLYGIGTKPELTFIWRIADEYDFGIERL